VNAVLRAADDCRGEDKNLSKRRNPKLVPAAKLTPATASKAAEEEGQVVCDEEDARDAVDEQHVEPTADAGGSVSATRQGASEARQTNRGGPHISPSLSSLANALNNLSMTRMPGVLQAGRQAGRQAGKQVARQAGRQAAASQPASQPASQTASQPLHLLLEIA
jgi:hypothetical protein